MEEDSSGMTDGLTCHSAHAGSSFMFRTIESQRKIILLTHPLDTCWSLPLWIPASAGMTICLFILLTSCLLANLNIVFWNFRLEVVSSINKPRIRITILSYIIKSLTGSLFFFKGTDKDLDQIFTFFRKCLII